MTGSRRSTLVAAALAACLVGCERPTPAAAPEGDALGPTPARQESPVQEDSNTLRVGESVITVVLTGRVDEAPRAELLAWVRRSAEAVAAYLGRFPVPELEVTLDVGRGDSVGFGQHWDGRWIAVDVGARISRAELLDDWVMVHEMLHAGFPDLADRHKWMQEGLSTYLEPIVRVRAGTLTRARAWQRWRRSMPHGVPRGWDRGLDNTRSWGSLYWGGALFWLLADVEIRARTGNNRDLGDAIRGILARGGDGRVAWTTARVVEVGDAATGTTVLRERYEAMARQRGDVDLDQLWARLGVDEAPGGIAFDERAPLAVVCQAITASE